MIRLASLGSWVAIVLAASANKPFQASHDTAKANAHDIFNAVHSAARQWGSSLNHNGLGFIPAIVPKGTVLYHGSHSSTVPDQPEWLAFETEHAELFAQARWYRDPDKQPGADWTDAFVEQRPLKRGPGTGNRGYLHTYQATRNLKLLYLDGSAAAKGTFGTLDQQDYVLRINATQSPVMDEWPRARELCEIVTSWGYDGLVRMELGFEVIHCNFDKGLKLVTITRTLVWEDKSSRPGALLYDWARAGSRRYDGIGAGRIELDFSGMVSGFWYPMNISSQTPKRPELYRLASAEKEELAVLRDAIEEVAKRPWGGIAKWQGVVDQIITRFADRFSTMVADEGVSDRAFVDELETLVLSYYDAPPLPGDDEAMAEYLENREKDALRRCQREPMLPILMFEEELTEQDKLIRTAIEEVMRTICTTVQQTWSQLAHDTSLSVSYAFSRSSSPINSKPSREDVAQAKKNIEELMNQLKWTIWKRKKPCPADSFLFVAMWPLGKEEDHWNPGCRRIGRDREFRSWLGYWNLEIV